MGGGISPDMFGPSMWATIHYICLGAGDNVDHVKQNALRQFFTLLPSVIPCGSCSLALPGELQKLPIDESLASSSDLFKWSVALHNSVNRRLGKPEVSVEKAKAFWMMGKNDKASDTKDRVAFDKYYFFIFGLFVGIALYIGLRSF